jgi:hypothetical protein
VVLGAVELAEVEKRCRGIDVIENILFPWNIEWNVSIFEGIWRRSRDFCVVWAHIVRSQKTVSESAIMKGWTVCYWQLPKIISIREDLPLIFIAFCQSHCWHFEEYRIAFG